MNLEQLLKQNFSYDEFRPGQKEIMESIIEGRDTLVLMPTGGGKSICYQIPALAAEGTAIIISPLIALMKDQVDALLKRNLPASFINSSLSYEEISNILLQAKAGYYKLLYIAPERLSSSYFLRELSRLKISFIAVDEAHCISEWGHDFRPAYRNIADALSVLPKMPIIALTATATPEVRADISKSLKMQNPQIFAKGFDRTNLNYLVIEAKNKDKELLEICQKIKEGSIIIYCGSRKRVDSTFDMLNQNNIKTLKYHAGMNDSQRKLSQEAFIKGKYNVIVATNAFGMGIDKADVRAVIHTDLPGTLEAYYQEAGRAGRDGKKSDCIMLYKLSDRKLQEFFIEASYPFEEDIVAVYRTVKEATKEKGANPFDRLDQIQIAELAADSNVKEYGLNSILNIFEKNNILRRNVSLRHYEFMFLASEDEVQYYFNKFENTRKDVFEALLRNASSNAFRRAEIIDVQDIQRKYAIKQKDFENETKALIEFKLISLKPMELAGGGTIWDISYAEDKLPIQYDEIERMRNFAYKKLDKMEEYAQTGTCKRNFILDYFDDDEIDTKNSKCGRCTSCLNPQKANSKTFSQKKMFIQTQVMRALEEYDARFGVKMICDLIIGNKTERIVSYNMHHSHSFGSAAEFSEQEIRNIIFSMIREGLIYSSGEYPVLSLDKPKLLNDSFVKNEQSDSKFSVRKKSNTANLYQKINNIRAENDYQIQAMPSKLTKKENIISIYSKKRYSLTQMAEVLKISTGETAIIIADMIKKNVDFDTQYLYDNSIHDKIRQITKERHNMTLKELREKINIDIDFGLLRIALENAKKM